MNIVNDRADTACNMGRFVFDINFSLFVSVDKGMEITLKLFFRKKVPGTLPKG
ncbi:MAG: hypothetical protein LBI14_06705 [Treponema sp.]|jgi:hypothetical protein|nr:hypothetical protein [Treponema sp.]